MSTGIFFIILLLLVLVCYLIIQIKKTEKNHYIKIRQLQDVIFQLVKEQNIYSLNVKLSEELKSKLLEARISLDQNLLDLQYELFSKIATKK